MRELKLVCPICESENITKIETDNAYNTPYYCFNCNEKFDLWTLEKGFIYALNIKRYVNETSYEYSTKTK